MEQLEEIQKQYDITNRRAIKIIVRSHIYGANEATEMELGIKKITMLAKRGTLNLIWKVVLEQGTLHNKLF